MNKKKMLSIRINGLELRMATKEAQIAGISRTAYIEQCIHKVSIWRLRERRRLERIEE